MHINHARIFSGLMCVAIFAISPAYIAAESLYSKISDAKTCKLTAEPESADGPAHEFFVCSGPIANVQTELLRGNDYDHLYVVIDGRTYSLWQPMLDVGTFSGVTGGAPLGEWVFQSGRPKTRAALYGFIVRFTGTQQDDTGLTNTQKSALAVIGLTKGKICWKGNVGDNTAARNLLINGACKTLVPAE